MVVLSKDPSCRSSVQSYNNIPVRYSLHVVYIVFLVYSTLYAASSYLFTLSAMLLLQFLFKTYLLVLFIVCLAYQNPIGLFQNSQSLVARYLFMNKTLSTKNITKYDDDSQYE